MNTEEIIHHERAIVGMCLLDPSVIDRVELQLGVYPWIDFPSGKIWQAIVDMRLSGEPVGDIRLVALKLKGQVTDSDPIGTGSFFGGYDSRMQPGSSPLLPSLELSSGEGISADRR